MSLGISIHLWNHHKVTEMECRENAGSVFSGMPSLELHNSVRERKYQVSPLMPKMQISICVVLINKAEDTSIYVLAIPASSFVIRSLLCYWSLFHRGPMILWLSQWAIFPGSAFLCCLVKVDGWRCFIRVLLLLPITGCNQVQGWMGPRSFLLNTSKVVKSLAILLIAKIFNEMEMWINKNMNK